MPWDLLGISFIIFDDFNTVCWCVFLSSRWKWGRWVPIPELQQPENRSVNVAIRNTRSITLTLSKLRWLSFLLSEKYHNFSDALVPIHRITQYVFWFIHYIRYNQTFDSHICDFVLFYYLWFTVIPFVFKLSKKKNNILHVSFNNKNFMFHTFNVCALLVHVIVFLARQTYRLCNHLLNVVHSDLSIIKWILDFFYVWFLRGWGCTRWRMYSVCSFFYNILILRF